MSSRHSKWCDTPCDMLEHGGYGVVACTARGKIAITGPFCWYENAEREAAKQPSGLVVRWRDRSTTAEILQEQLAAVRLERRRAYKQAWRARTVEHRRAYWRRWHAKNRSGKAAA